MVAACARTHFVRAQAARARRRNHVEREKGALISSARRRRCDTRRARLACVRVTARAAAGIVQTPSGFFGRRRAPSKPWRMTDGGGGRRRARKGAAPQRPPHTTQTLKTLNGGCSARGCFFDPPRPALVRVVEVELISGRCSALPSAFAGQQARRELGRGLMHTLACSRSRAALERRTLSASGITRAPATPASKRKHCSS